MYFVSSTQIYNIVKVLELNILVNNLIGMCTIRIFENNLLALIMFKYRYLWCKISAVQKVPISLFVVKLWRGWTVSEFIYEKSLKLLTPLTVVNNS